MEYKGNCGAVQYAFQFIRYSISEEFLRDRIQKRSYTPIPEMFLTTEETTSMCIQLLLT